MPRPIKKRVKKKESETEVEVKDKLSELKNQLRERRRTVMAYGIAAGVAVIVIAGVFYYRYSSEEKSRLAESEAYSYYYGENLRQPMANKQEQTQKALVLFKKAYDYKNSPRLLLYIANSNYELGRFDDAISSLNEFFRKYPSDQELTPLAYKMMANAQLQKGDKEGALKTLNTLYASPGAIYKDFALMESARILEGEGKTAEAAAKYRELAAKFKSSPYYAEAESKLSGKKEDQGAVTP